MGKDMFRGRDVVIATQHKKEAVIGPLLVDRLQVQPIVVDGLNTDSLGTFSGEVERELSPLDAARAKCRMAMEMSGCDIAIASEGSFGMHPYLPFFSANDEMVLMMDRANQIEIVGRKLSSNTNFSGQAVKTRKQLNTFAEKADFPNHGLILRNQRNDVRFLEKGIVTWKKLYESFDKSMKQFGEAYVETDMRALYNPRRMDVIRDATLDLLSRTETVCPKCSSPGYGITDYERGLPCGACGSPTKTTAYYIYSCNQCGYTKQSKNREKQFEDPQFCDVCNP